MVVREGERVSADQILKLRAIRESGRDNRSLQTAAGLIICILLLFYVGFYFGQKISVNLSLTPVTCCF